MSPKSLIVTVVVALLALFGTLFGTLWTTSTTRDLTIRELQMTHLEALQGDEDEYETKRATVHVLAGYGIDVALEYEFPFRSGATIRALEELRDSRRTNEEEKTRINESLDGVRRVLFIDSVYKSNVYCSDTARTAGTNIDDIELLVRDFPIRAVARKGDVVGLDALATEVQTHRPEVIVAHVGSFAGLEYQDLPVREEMEKMKRFLDKIYQRAEYLPTVILYSRRSVYDMAPIRTNVMNTRSDVSDSNFILLPMEDDVCFYAESVNGQRLTAAIRRIIRFDDLLYERDLSLMGPRPGMSAPTALSWPMASAMLLVIVGAVISGFIFLRRNRASN